MIWTFFALFSVSNSRILRSNEKNRLDNRTLIKFGIFTIVVTTRQNEEKASVESAYICCKINNDLWISSVDLKSFESIHGVSRIVKLIPDKLATAIAINKENLLDPKDDGSFLVDLVLKLLTFYQEQVQKNFNCQKLSEIEALLEEECNKMMTLYNFLDILNQLSTELESFNAALPTRENDVIKSQAEKVLRLADNLQIFCQVYLDLVHPALIKVIKVWKLYIVLSTNSIYWCIIK